MEQFNLFRVVDNDRYPAFFELNGSKYYLMIKAEKNFKIILNMSFKIGDRTIAPNKPPYIIAELSANHNGSLERALNY